MPSFSPLLYMRARIIYEHIPVAVLDHLAGPAALVLRVLTVLLPVADVGRRHHLVVAAGVQLEQGKEVCQRKE